MPTTGSGRQESGSDPDDLRAYVPGNRQKSIGIAAAPRIEHEGTSDALVARCMGMAEDDDIHVVELAAYAAGYSPWDARTMNDPNLLPGSHEELFAGQSHLDCRAVHVAADSLNLSQRSKSLKNRRFREITGMDDKVHVSQRPQHGGWQLLHRSNVSVSEHSESHGPAPSFRVADKSFSTPWIPILEGMGPRDTLGLPAKGLCPSAYPVELYAQAIRAPLRDTSIVTPSAYCPTACRAATYPNTIDGPMVAPAPAYEFPITEAEQLPVAYRPSIGDPSWRSTRA